MKIMHYFLGFPPYRSGGMTKFAYDLMCLQLKIGNDVSALWPGEIKFFSSSVSIKKRSGVNGIKNYEIINPLPISYDEGIKDVNAFTRKSNLNIYECFLEDIKPDVIHIHTLMGLHKEFVIATKKLKIKTVYTTHDFFPICPKVTMYRKEKICDGNQENCPNCNARALSLNKIILLQKPLYRVIKSNSFVKELRKRHRTDFFLNDEETSSEVESREYKRLRDYYLSILSLVDVIHFNSSVAKKCYLNYLTPKNSVIIPISHSDIQDLRKKKYFNGTLKITYLGAGSGAKGYFILKRALDNLWDERKDFELNLYFKPLEITKYMRIHERYDYDQLEDVFSNTDIVIVPSLWNETFGYTALEALSFGIPVILSGTVGAKDIMEEGCGIIIDKIDEKKIAKTINGLNQEVLQDMNNMIIHKQKIILMKEVEEQLEKVCY